MMNIIDDEHFLNKLNADLEKVRGGSREVKSKRDDRGAASNSPVIMSANNSDTESDTGACSDIRLLTYREVRDSIHKYYDAEHKYINELELLTSYLHCQKHIYIQSADIAGYKMCALAIPASIGTIFVSILAFMWETGIPLASMNVAVGLLYFTIYYFRFLPAVSFYRQIAKQYEKIENISECIANQYGFLDKSVDKVEYVLENLRSIEQKYMDLKDMLVMEVPREVVHMYPIGFRISMFSFIKRIETNKKNLIVQLKDVKNEVRYIENKGGDAGGYKSRLDCLYETKERIKVQIIHYVNSYGYMEDILTREIRRGSRCWFRWILPGKRSETCENPVVAAYCESIFADD